VRKISSPTFMLNMGFVYILLENITEENFTDVKAVIMDSLQNMTEIDDRNCSNQAYGRL